MDAKKITKSNAIINASYRLSLNELRIVLYGLSQINPHKGDFPLFHRINIRELAEFFDIGEKDRGSFYEDVQNALINKFWEREFSYFDDELNKVVKRRWLIEVQYGGNDGILAYHYNPLIKNQLQQLANRFTSYFLKNVGSMKSAYAVRIYEIAIMYLNASGKSKAVFTKEIDSIKEQLGISDKYGKFHNFKAKVLEIAKRDINKHSDIKLTYRVIKLGRSANEIEFTVSKKELTTPVVLLEKPSTKVIEQAKEIAAKKGKRVDIYQIEEEFKAYARQKGMPDNVNKAFIGFVKKKIDSID